MLRRASSPDKNPRLNEFIRAGNLYLKFRKLLFYPRPTGVSRAGIELWN